MFLENNKRLSAAWLPKRFIVTATRTIIGNPKAHRIAEAQQNMREIQTQIRQENDPQQVRADLHYGVNLQNASKG